MIERTFSWIERSEKSAAATAELERTARVAADRLMTRLHVPPGQLGQTYREIFSQMLALVQTTEMGRRVLARLPETTSVYLAPTFAESSKQSGGYCYRMEQNIRAIMNGFEMDRRLPVGQPVIVLNMNGVKKEQKRNRVSENPIIKHFNRVIPWQKIFNRRNLHNLADTFIHESCHMIQITPFPALKQTHEYEMILAQYLSEIEPVLVSKLFALESGDKSSLSGYMQALEKKCEKNFLKQDPALTPENAQNLARRTMMASLIIMMLSEGNIADMWRRGQKKFPKISLSDYAWAMSMDEWSLHYRKQFVGQIRLNTIKCANGVESQTDIEFSNDILRRLNLTRSELGGQAFLMHLMRQIAERDIASGLRQLITNMKHDPLLKWIRKRFGKKSEYEQGVKLCLSAQVETTGNKPPVSQKINPQSMKAVLQKSAHVQTPEQSRTSAPTRQISPTCFIQRKER